MTGIAPLIGAFFFHPTLIGESLCHDPFIRAAFVGAALGPSFLGPSFFGQSSLVPALRGEAFLRAPLVDAALFGRRHGGSS